MATGPLIGIWPYELTDEIIQYLKPAADLAGKPIETGPGWHTWTIHDGRVLIGAAHIRRTTKGFCEVCFVGGTRSREWLARLDQMIGEFAELEGCRALRAFGRQGWRKSLVQQGWRAEKLKDGGMAYERGLTHG